MSPGQRVIAMLDTLENCYAVIFSTVFGEDTSGYDETVQELRRLAEAQAGYLGMESVNGGGREITVSYWRDLDSINAWKEHPRHRAAREKGRTTWYQYYDIKVVKIAKHYDFKR